MKYPLIAVAVLTFAGCSETLVGPTHVPCDPFLTAFGTAVGDTITTTEGLKYIDVEVGTGAAAAGGRSVDVNYSGYLLDGTRFDSSCPGSRAVLRFTLGNNNLIEGFDLGIGGMQLGGVRRVIIPPELGYGPVANGPIPANSTLVFDLELVR